MDKLIKAIEKCLSDEGCRGCPYTISTDCQRKIKREAHYYLLKLEEIKNDTKTDAEPV